MSLSGYSRYRDSGVEWLGPVPEHWEVARLKRIAQVSPSNVDKKSCDGEAPVRLCNYTDVYYNDRITPDAEFMPATASAEQIEKFTLRAGDTIVTKDSETADDIAVAAYVPQDVPGVVCGYHLSLIRPRGSQTGAFIKRFFDSAFAKAAVQVRANGLTRVGLTQYALDNLPVPVPPSAERMAITGFLDDETDKIDALVSEQRRLVQLLTEKRQALVSRAVTRGLDPDAPLKPSGADWLGDVPAHWRVGPLRRFDCRVQAGPFGSQLHADEYVTGGVPLVNPVNLVAQRIVPNEHVTVPRAVLDRLPHQVLREGDIVFSRRGELGRCALVTEREAGWMCGTGSMIVRLAHVGLEPAYLTRYLSLTLLKQYFESFSIGAIMDSLSSATLLGMPLLVPPPAEQRAIVEFIRREDERVGLLVAEAERAIALLRERRTALISAAVTGKIDVRGRAQAA